MANDIVLATSRDGVTWSPPERVPLGRSGVFVDHFVPGLAVDRTTAGRRARVAIAFHSMPQCDFRGCRGVDVGLITSVDGGRSWGRPDRLNAESMPLWWIADGAIGRMLGDSISTSYVNGRPIPVFALASRPTGGEYRQSIFALTSRR